MQSTVVTIRVDNALNFTVKIINELNNTKGVDSSTEPYASYTIFNELSRRILTVCNSSKRPIRKATLRVYKATERITGTVRVEFGDYRFMSKTIKGF